MSRLSFLWTVPSGTRRAALACLWGAGLLARQGPAKEAQSGQFPDDTKRRLPPDHNEEDPRLPDGKSQKNAIAKAQHEQALKDAEQLVSAAQDLRKELQEAGTYVVPLNSVRRTEEIEKLAKRIRGRLKS